MDHASNEKGKIAGLKGSKNYRALVTAKNGDYTKCHYAVCPAIYGKASHVFWAAWAET
jgi:hypothetical protein